MGGREKQGGICEFFSLSIRGEQRVGGKRKCKGGICHNFASLPISLPTSCFSGRVKLKSQVEQLKLNDMWSSCSSMHI